MSALDRFRDRNEQKDSTVLPAEVNEYYTADQNGRKGVAFLLGIITLVITLVVAGGLFLSGRFVYRKIVGNDQPSTTQTDKAGDKNQTAQNASPSSPPPNSQKSTPHGTTPPSTPPATTPAPSSSIPDTGDAPGGLPNTGDDAL